MLDESTELKGMHSGTRITNTFFFKKESLWTLHVLVMVPYKISNVTCQFLLVLTRQTSMEVVYKQLVRDNFSTFTKQTDMSSISSLLIQKKLTSHDEYECMVRRTDKSHYFYTSVLPGKGDGAYTLL